MRFPFPNHFPKKFPFIDRKMWEKPKMDIVERIRLHWPDMTFELAEEAADEIERLREALKDISAECFVPHGTDKEMWEGWRAVAVERVDIARTALKGDE